MFLNGFARYTVLGLALCGACVGTEEGGLEADARAHIPKADASFAEAEQIDSGRASDISIPENAGPLNVEIGVPDSSSGLGFVPFNPGGEIPIAGLGQAGLTARIAVRFKTPEQTPLERAFVKVHIVNATDATREPAIRQFDVADELRCEPDAWCYAATIRVEISHLAKLPELEGTQVILSATLAADGDDKLSGAAHTWGTLASVQ